MIAKAFKDIILDEKQSTESCWNISVPYTSQGSSFAIISATSHYKFLGSIPFEIACGSYGQQLKYVKMQGYTESIWQ